MKQCFEVIVGVEAKEPEFREKLFNVSIMHAALKLQLIISQNLTDAESISYVRRALTQDLFGKMISKA